MTAPTKLTRKQREDALLTHVRRLRIDQMTTRAEVVAACDELLAAVPDVTAEELLVALWRRDQQQ